MEKAIDDLLEKGESSLCPMEKKEEGGAAPKRKALVKPIDAGKATEIVAEFKKVQGKIIDECKDDCKDMERAFFVLEEEYALNEAGELKGALAVHTVLVRGTTSAQEKVKGIAKEFLDKWANEITSNEQCMGGQ